MTEGRAPLHDVRVLECTTSVAGQAAGMLLADLGADVVRFVADDDVERTGLPGWLCWNRGKSIVHPVSDAEMDRLLPRADVLLVDLAPGALHAAGLDGHALRARAPALVQVWMPAITATGRWSELPHDHLLLDAVGGFAAHHPATEERPIASVVPARHMVHGALAAVAALAGLHGRRRDGWGRAATVTGLNAEAATLNTFVARSVDGPPLVSPGKLLPGSPNFRLYQGADGRWFYLAALSPELFIKALEVMDRLDVFGHPDVAGDFINFLRPEVAATIGAELDVTMATASADEWRQRFNAAGVPAALVSDPAEWLAGDVIAHACPPLIRNHPDVGEVILPGPPFRLELDAAIAGALPVPEDMLDPASLWQDVDAHPQPTGPPPGADHRPLDDLRVIDMATFLAAPFVSTLLAWHGADVVKVEAPTGDPYSVFTVAYSAIHEHKPRLAAVLNEDASRASFLELVSHADVVVDNLVASSLARLQLEPPAFAAANPDLVRCSVTAYGDGGPYAELPGFDPIMQTLSGLVAVQGGAGRPVATAAPTHDVATGCVGALSTLAALWVRRRDGHGQRVFTSLAATSTYLQSGELTSYAGRPVRPVGGPDFAGPSSAERFYRAADRWIAVSARTSEQAAAFLGLFGRADLATMDDAARAEAIADLIVQRPSEEWLAALAAAGVPACSAINRVELDDPELVRARYSHIVDTAQVGRLEVLGGYADWDHVDRRAPLPVDQLAADRDEVIARWSAARR